MGDFCQEICTAEICNHLGFFFNCILEFKVELDRPLIPSSLEALLLLLLPLSSLYSRCVSKRLYHAAEQRAVHCRQVARSSR